MRWRGRLYICNSIHTQRLVNSCRRSDVRCTIAFHCVWVSTKRVFLCRASLWNAGELVGRRYATITDAFDSSLALYQ